MLFVATVLSASPVSPTILVYTALPPNVFGSPSYLGWEVNALTAVISGATSAGTPGTPTYFEFSGIITPEMLTVTNFNSWKGDANPVATYGPAFANELGNRGAFPLKIDGNGSQFAIADLSFVAVSTDIDNSLGFSFGAGSYNYSGGYQGVLKGADGILWTNDDIFITSGPNTQFVDGLAGRGSGTGFWPCAPGDLTPCTTISEKQAAITNLASVLNGKKFSGQYSLNGATGGAEFLIESSTVPEPASWLLSFGGLIGVCVFVRRRQQQQRLSAR